MAGSPTRTLRRVERLEQQSITLADDVLHAAPAAFVQPDSKPVPFPRDPLRRAWLSAVEAAMTASVALEALGDHLRAKAGNGTVGPFAELRAGAIAQGGEEDGEQRNAGVRS